MTLRRARVARSSSDQQDLFAPAPVPDYPKSDHTGGPLSALEAERLVTGSSIRWRGYLWTGSGLVMCRDCACRHDMPDRDQGATGYRVTVYEARVDQPRIGACYKCGSVVRGEHCG